MMNQSKLYRLYNYCNVPHNKFITHFIEEERYTEELDKTIRRERTINTILDEY